MNIFFVDRDPEQCARDHCDKHVCKMVIEYGQLLSTAHRVLDGDDAPDEVYKIAHKNHPVQSGPVSTSSTTSGCMSFGQTCVKSSQSVTARSI